MATSAEISWLALRSERAELRERTWGELLRRGLPEQLYRFGRLLGTRNGRAIRVFSTPMLDAGISMAGLAVPLEGEDALVLDPRLLDHPRALSNVVARELARTAHPGWRDLLPDEGEEVEEFASVLAPLVLRSITEAAEVDTVVELAMDLAEADQRTGAQKDGPWRCSTRAHQPTTIA